MMRTRALTIDERIRLDSSWGEYIISSEHARDITSLSSTHEAIVETVAAWDAYVDYRRDHDIVTTLAGYRKRIAMT